MPAPISSFDTALHRLETQWQLKLPQTFRRLYRAFDYPFISPCEFLSLGEMLKDEQRWRGMLPQFLPFGHDGDENYFGFYALPNGPGGDYPVLAWDHEYDHYYPVASGFEPFLRWCVIYGRYMAQDEFEERAPEYEEEEAQRREFAELVGLPVVLVTDAIPRNERELYERLLRADGQSAYALSHLGSRFLGQGEVERARDCFVRASEAAPWFADPYYLLAETYRIAKQHARACDLWWQVFQAPIALSTRTSNYDLGDEETEAEVYEAATDHCIACGDALGPERTRGPLWELLQRDDPFAPGPRLALADALEREGDAPGVERELLNALTLATDDADIATAYTRLIAFYERAGRARDAALCRRDAAQKG